MLSCSKVARMKCFLFYPGLYFCMSEFRWRDKFREAEEFNVNLSQLNTPLQFFNNEGIKNHERIQRCFFWLI